MNWAIFSMEGLAHVLRWLHVFFGVIWIGLLYYFNFVQGAFFAETDATTKSGAIQKLVPRALMWFRHGALWTMITGILLIGLNQHTMGPGYFATSGGMIILIGTVIGLVMGSNVWFVIWPNQRIVIQNALDTAAGKPANSAAAACGAKAGLASRHNVLFSIPLLFFMLAARHMPIIINDDANLGIVYGVIFTIIALIEVNALKGKTGPITSIKGVIHMGFALTVVLYVCVEILTKI